MGHHNSPLMLVEDKLILSGCFKNCSWSVLCRLLLFDSNSNWCIFSLMLTSLYTYIKKSLKSFEYWCSYVTKKAIKGKKMTVNYLNYFSFFFLSFFFKVCRTYWHLCILCRFWKSQRSGVLFSTQVISVCFHVTREPLEDTDDGRQRMATATTAEIPVLGPAKLGYCWRQRAPHGFCSSLAVSPHRACLGSTGSPPVLHLNHHAGAMMHGEGGGGSTARCQFCRHERSQPFACSPASYFCDLLFLLHKWVPNQTQKQVLQKVLYVAGKQPNKINICCHKKIEQKVC